MKKDRGVRVGVVAGDPLRRLGLEAILQDAVGLTAVGLDLAGAAADKNLAALLLDMRMCGDALGDIVGRLRQDRPEMKIVLVGESSEPQVMQEAIGAGAKGYLLETAGESEIRMAMEVVLDGSVWAPRKVLAKLIDVRKESVVVPQSPGSVDRIAAKMTPREMDVLRLLMEGRSNREIAKAMGIDEVTVKAHLGRMLRKTGTTNRVELTLRAMEEEHQLAE